MWSYHIPAAVKALCPTPLTCVSVHPRVRKDLGNLARQAGSDPGVPFSLVSSCALPGSLQLLVTIPPFLPLVCFRAINNLLMTVAVDSGHAHYICSFFLLGGPSRPRCPASLVAGRLTYTQQNTVDRNVVQHLRAWPETSCSFPLHHRCVHAHLPDSGGWWDLGEWRGLGTHMAPWSRVPAQPGTALSKTQGHIKFGLVTATGVSGHK